MKTTDPSLAGSSYSAEDEQSSFAATDQSDAHMVAGRLEDRTETALPELVSPRRAIRPRQRKQVLTADKISHLLLAFPSRGAKACKLDLGEMNCSHRRDGDRSAMPTPHETRESYAATRSFGIFAHTFGFTHYEAIKALAHAGIDIFEDVGADWQNGQSSRSLSDRHGVTRATICRWIKKTGRKMLPRNQNRTYDEDLIKQAFQKGTANKAATTARVHWLTARRILKEMGEWGIRRESAKARDPNGIGDG